MANNYLAEFCMEKGLRQDRQSGTLFGVCGGYHIAVGMENVQNNQVSLVFSVTRGGVGPDLGELKQAIKGVKVLKKVNVARYQVVFTASWGGVGQKRIAEKTGEALEAAIALLRERGYQDCCQGCGSVTATATCMAGGAPAHLCQDCFNGQSDMAGQRIQTEIRKQENLPAGIVGGLIGSLVGVLAIVLLDQLGFVAAISGFVMAVCTIKGYELLGGKLTKKSILVCAVIMVVMVYIGNQISWAIAVMQAFSAGFGDSFQAVPALLSEGIIESGPYYGNLALVYLFTALGAWSPMRSALRKKELGNLAYIMN